MTQRLENEDYKDYRKRLKKEKEELKKKLRGTLVYASPKGSMPYKKKK